MYYFVLYCLFFTFSYLISIYSLIFHWCETAMSFINKHIYYYNRTHYCSTETGLLIFPSFRPTSHLRCGQVEVRECRTPMVTPAKIYHIPAVFQHKSGLRRLINWITITISPIPVGNPCLCSHTRGKSAGNPRDSPLPFSCSSLAWTRTLLMHTAWTVSGIDWIKLCPHGWVSSWTTKCQALS